MRIPLLISFLIILGLTTQTSAQDQDNTLNIVAVVGENIITEYDLEQRNRMIINNAGLPDTLQTRQDIRPQILDQLIQESVQIQEAESIGVLPDRERAESTFENIAKNNNVTVEALKSNLRQQRVDPNTLIDQIYAKLAWNAVLRRQVLPTIQVAESEINLVFEKINQLQNQVQINLAEIFIAKGNIRQNTEKLRLIERLHAQVMEGGRFSSIAQQFSESTTAETSGQLGWKLLAELEPKLAESAKNLQKGEISDIIETPQGFYILAALDRRGGNIRNQQTTANMLQIVFPVNVQNTPSVQEVTQQALQQTSTLNTCDTFRETAQSIGTQGSGDFGTVSFGSLSEAYQNIVTDLPQATPSEPFLIPAGLAVIMVCNVKVPQIELPTRDQIATNIRLERLTVSGRRYLRDLMRDTTIELR